MQKVKEENEVQRQEIEDLKRKTAEQVTSNITVKRISVFLYYSYSVYIVSSFSLKASSELKLGELQTK